MANQHTIQRATINLQLPEAGPIDAGAIRGWCVSVLLEELDAVLSEQCPDDQMLVIANLQLDLTLPNWNETPWFNQKDAVRQQIREQVASQLQPSELRLPLDEYRAEILLRYFQTGSLPNRYAKLEWVDLQLALQQTSRQNRSFRVRLLRVLADKPAFRRWFHLMDESFRYAWFDEQLPVSVGSWRELIGQLHLILNRHQPEQPVSVQELTFTIIKQWARGIDQPETLLRAVLEKWVPLTTGFPKTPEQLQSDAIERFFADLFSGIENRMPSDLDGPSTPVLPPDPKPVSAIPNPPSIPDINPESAVSAAGLVLVAAFLPAFLRRVGLLDTENQFVNQSRIPILLYYIATGDTYAGEWQLVLPKILCGIPVAQSCDTSIELSDQEKQEVTHLLTDVIEHWGRLKTTTPDGLRVTFLQRMGRLTETETHLNLTIPEEPFDLLLPFIPWSFRYIRFSWMKKILTVKWGNKD